MFLSYYTIFYCIILTKPAKFKTILNLIAVWFIVFCYIESLPILVSLKKIMSPCSCVKPYYIILRHHTAHIQYTKLVSWYTVQYYITIFQNIMLHYLLRYTTLLYVTHAIYMLYFYILFPGCLTVDTHTRHFTTKRIFGNVRRDSLVDLWHTVLEKCVARIPLRPACHCCP